MRIELTENEFAALTLLKSTGVPTLEAAQLACAAIKAGRGKVNRALRLARPEGAGIGAHRRGEAVFPMNEIL